MASVLFSFLQGSTAVRRTFVPLITTRLEICQRRFGMHTTGSWRRNHGFVMLEVCKGESALSPP